MSVLLELASNRKGIVEEQEGEYDPQAQVWSTVSRAQSVQDALKIFASGSTTQSGTTGFKKSKYKGKEIEVADQDGDDTDT